MESEAKALCSIFMKFIKIFKKYSQQLTWNYGIFLSLFSLSDHGNIRGVSDWTTATAGRKKSAITV